MTVERPGVYNNVVTRESLERPIFFALPLRPPDSSLIDMATLLSGHSKGL